MNSIPIKRHEVGRIVATEMREYMKVSVSNECEPNRTLTTS